MEERNPKRPGDRFWGGSGARRADGWRPAARSVSVGAQPPRQRHKLGRTPTPARSPQDGRRGDFGRAQTRPGGRLWGDVGGQASGLKERSVGEAFLSAAAAAPIPLNAKQKQPRPQGGGQGGAAGNGTAGRRNLLRRAGPGWSGQQRKTGRSRGTGQNRTGGRRSPRAARADQRSRPWPRIAARE